LAPEARIAPCATPSASVGPSTGWAATSCGPRLVPGPTAMTLRGLYRHVDRQVALSDTREFSGRARSSLELVSAPAPIPPDSAARRPRAQGP
jgi:hypothetical protein